MAMPMPGLLIAAGLLAAAIGYRMGLARWWLPVQALFPLAAAAGLWLPVPAWVYAAAFVLLLAVQWNAARSGVPLYLTNRQTGAAVLDLLPGQQGMAVADIGSGLGGLLVGLAQARPDGRFTGIETAPVPFAIAWLRQAMAGPAGRLRFVYGDYRQQDFSAFDVVYCFLSPVPMPDVHAKARREMRPGCLLISNSFAVPGYPADEVRVVADRRGTRLHIWRF